MKKCKGGKKEGGVGKIERGGLGGGGEGDVGVEGKGI